MDSDGEVTILDVGTVSNAYASGVYYPECDVDCDGNITILDVGTVCSCYASEKKMGVDAFCLDGDHSWYTSGGGDYTMWQYLDSEAVENLKGKQVMFKFWFRPESNSSETYARAEINYTDPDQQWAQGDLVNATKTEWYSANVTVILPDTTTSIKVIIHGWPDFKAYIDCAYLIESY